MRLRFGTARSRTRAVGVAAVALISVVIAVLVFVTTSRSTGVVSDGDSPSSDGALAEVPVGSGVGGDGAPGGNARSWPTEPPARVCGNPEILGGGPSAAPPGAASVPAGDNSDIDFGKPDTTYWFAPGTHTLGNHKFSQIIPGNNSRFLGAPGAIIDGQGVNKYAFVQDAVDVTVEYLTIQNFAPSNSESVVNQSAARGWTIQFNTIQNNRGAGVNIGTDNVVRYNCLTRNGQYGFKSYHVGDGPSNITLDHNEISYNNTEDWETKKPGCGCTGGGKFWSVTDAKVTNNYVHHNHGPGLWADTNNIGFLFKGNYFYENDSVGLFYEISYNALIRDNTFVRNGLEAGASNTGFPTGAVYISESGSDRRAGSTYSTVLDITRNYFVDNWGGVVLWENANRFCGSPKQPTADCTPVNPDATLATCTDPADGGLIDTAPYYSDCRWKTQNVKVRGNIFVHRPANIGPKCTFENHCGVVAVLSNWGNWPDWSPYQGDIIQEAVTFRQNNTWNNNTYIGEWMFVPFKAGNLKTFAEWRSAPSNQDQGSKYE